MSLMPREGACSTNFQISPPNLRPVFFFQFGEREFLGLAHAEGPLQYLGQVARFQPHVQFGELFSVPTFLVTLQRRA